MDRTENTEGHEGTVGAQPPPAQPAPAQADAANGLPSAGPASHKPEDVSGSQAPRSSDEETKRRAKRGFLYQVSLLCASIIFSASAYIIVSRPGYESLFFSYRSLFFNYRSLWSAPGFAYHGEFIFALVSSVFL